MTSLLVTSDTHVADAAQLPGALLELAARADHIVHAGDLSSADVIDVLAAFAPVTAVRGNVEQAEVVERLPERGFCTVSGVRIGVVHIAGVATGRHERLARMLPDCRVRVYGHSHMPEIAELADGSLVVNPGSPVQRRRAPFHSCAWVDISEEKISANLINLDER